MDLCYISLIMQEINQVATKKFQHKKRTFMTSPIRFLFPLFLFLLIGFHVQAQSTKPQYWFTYNHTGRVSDRWSYGFDLNYRTKGILPFNSSLSAARIGMNFHTKKGFRFTGGYAWFGTFVPQEDRIWLQENRIYEQAQYTHSKGKLNLVHRIRIEHRWRQQFLDISLEDTDVLFTNRYRYLFQVDGPIKREAQRTTNLRWQVANEFFIHNTEEVGYMLFDQNRTLAGVMISPKGNLSLALLYQLIIQQQPLLREVQTVHSFRITLFHHLDLRRIKKDDAYEVPVID
jgi:hypothetical protein